VPSLDTPVALARGSWSDGYSSRMCSCPIGGDTDELHAGGVVRALATQQSLVRV
jgi:hypothetical protein